MAARRPYSTAEADIIRSGARAGRAGGVIVEQLLAAGFTRTPAGVLSSAAFAEGRADLERDRKQAQLISHDAAARAKAAKAIAPTPHFPKLSDRIIYDAAKGGASLNAIADALQAAGCGNPCTTTISRSAAYREGKGRASEPRVPQPWAARECEIVTDGARQGLNGPAICKALAAAGFDRNIRTITASSYYAKGRQMGRDDAALAAAAILPVSASPPAPAVVNEVPRIVTRFNGVSLPYLSIQKGFGEVVTR